MTILQIIEFKTKEAIRFKEKTQKLGKSKENKNSNTQSKGLILLSIWDFCLILYWRF